MITDPLLSKRETQPFYAGWFSGALNFTAAFGSGAYGLFLGKKEGWHHAIPFALFSLGMTLNGAKDFFFSRKVKQLQQGQVEENTERSSSTSTEQEKDKLFSVLEKLKQCLVEKKPFSDISFDDTDLQKTWNSITQELNSLLSSKEEALKKSQQNYLELTGKLQDLQLKIAEVKNNKEEIPRELKRKASTLTNSMAVKVSAIIEEIVQGFDGADLISLCKTEGIEAPWLTLLEKINALIEKINRKNGYETDSSKNNTPFTSPIKSSTKQITYSSEEE